MEAIMSPQDQKSNQFHTASDYEVKAQQQFWNRYMNPGYQPAYDEDEEPEPHHELEWEHEYDPLNRAFDPNEIH